MLSRIFSKVKLPFSRQEMLHLSATFAAGLLIYLSIASSLLGNPDSVTNSFYYKGDHSWENSLGRFGLGVVDGLRGNLVLPVFSTLFSLLCLGVIAVLVCRLFRLEGLLPRAAASAILLLSPQFATTLTYYYCSDSYLISYLFCVLAALLLVCGRPKYTAGAAVLLSLSLTLYQAYICVTLSLCVFYFLLRLVDGTAQPRQVLMDGLQSCMGIGSGVVLYLLLFKLHQLVGGYTPANSRGMDSMGQTSFAQLLRTYPETFRYYFTDNLLNNSWMHRNLLNLILFLLAAVMVVLLLLRSGKAHLLPRLGLAALLCAAAPVALMFTLIMAPQVSIYDSTGLLMLPQMGVLYLFVLALACHALPLVRPVSAAAGVMLAAVLWVQLLWVGAFQQCLQLNRTQAQTVASAVEQEIHPLFADGQATGLMFIGTAQNGNYPQQCSELYTICHGSVACYGMFWEDSFGTNQVWKGYLRQMVGVDYPFASAEQRAQIAALPEVEAMPCFPAEGSVQLVNSICVVKLS